METGQAAMDLTTQIATYGFAGLCCAFFMARDIWNSMRKEKADKEREERYCEVIDKNTDVIKDFTVALNILVNKK